MNTRGTRMTTTRNPLTRGSSMITTPVVEFSPVHFCEALNSEAKKVAKKRTGQEPTANHMQMVDLLTAFRELRQSDATEHFGLIVGEKNESMAIISTYLEASDPKAPKTLHPELGLSIGTLIGEWGRFEELPKETQNRIKKAKQTFLKTEDKLLERVRHFFNEMKIRASSLESIQKEGVLGLIALYLPQVTDACHRREVNAALHLLKQVDMDLNRLAAQLKEPSRPLATLVIKTRRDLAEFDSFGNKGKKSKK